MEHKLDHVEHKLDHVVHNMVQEEEGVLYGVDNMVTIVPEGNK